MGVSYPSEGEGDVFAEAPDHDAGQGKERRGFVDPNQFVGKGGFFLVPEAALDEMLNARIHRGVSGSAATADSDQVDPFLSIIAVPRGSGPGWPGDPGTSGSSRE